MSDVKKKLMEEISKKADRMKARKQEIANREKNVEAFVLKEMKDIDDASTSTINSSLGPAIQDFYVGALGQRLKTLDEGCKVEISWAPQNDGESVPRLNGVLIKWSKGYQVANKCDPELFIDIANLLFV